MLQGDQKSVLTVQRNQSNLSQSTYPGYPLLLIRVLLYIKSTLTRFVSRRFCYIKMIIELSYFTVLQGYDISFLVTNFHTEQMFKHKLVDFIIHFMEEIDKEISEMKLAVNSRARISAEEFLKRF